MNYHNLGLDASAPGLLTLFCPMDMWTSVVVVVALLFYVHGKHLRACQDGQLT